MSEYVVKGAEPNETVLHTRTKNGFEEWMWLPVREEIVRCKDCEYMERQTTYDGSMSWFLCSHFKRPTRCDGYCAWGVRS